MHKKRTNKILWIGSQLLLYIFYFLINWLTPLLADDYNMKMHYIQGTTQQIRGVSDVFFSAWNAYTGWTGRMESHIFSIIAAFMPHTVFAAWNAAIYMLGIWLIYRICIGDGRQNVMLYMIIHIFIWVFVPDYGQVMFWMCGSVCYLWPSIFVFLTILIFRLYAVREGKMLQTPVWIPVLLILGLFAGNAMENMSAGMLVILTGYLLYNRRFQIRISAPLLALYVGSIIGFLMLILAPGNYVRQTGSEQLGFLFKLGILAYYFVFFMGAMYVIYAMMIYCYKKQLDMRQPGAFWQSVILAVAALASVACLVVTPSLPERAWYIGCAYAVMMLGILFTEVHVSIQDTGRQMLRIAVLGMGIFYVVSLCDTVVTTYDIRRQTQSRDQYVAAELKEGHLDVCVPAIEYTYPFRSHHDALQGLYDVQKDETHWVNQLIARYYGIHTIRAE